MTGTPATTCECDTLLIFTSDDVRSLSLLGAIRRTELKLPVRQLVRGAPGREVVS